MMSKNSELSRFSVSSGFVAVATNQGTYTLSAPKPEKIDKPALEDIIAYNEYFSEINSVTSQSLFKYLLDISHAFSDEDWYEALADFEQCASDNGLKNALIGKPTSGLNKAFHEIQRMFNSNLVPTDHMSFVLHKLGQPILRGSKLGWGHIKDFNPAQTYERQFAFRQRGCSLAA